MELLSSAPVTSSDEIALQFYWQGYDAYLHCKDRENVTPCFYNAQCLGQSNDGEFVHIVPVEEIRERLILDEMKVQIVSVGSGKYLRGTRVSKYLKWSSSRDEQTVFQINIFDRKPLTLGSKFTLTSCFWPGHAIGFTQAFPLGGSRELTKAIGFLTVEKKKHQAPLLFPIRFRAVRRDLRHLSAAAQASTFEHPTPFVTVTDLLFIGEENASSVANIPVARVVSPMDAGATATPEDDIFENCSYCGALFRSSTGLLAHIRDYHGEILHRESIAGSFCIYCGYRQIDGICERCGRQSN